MPPFARLRLHSLLHFRRLCSDSRPVRPSTALSGAPPAAMAIKRAVSALLLALLLASANAQSMTSSPTASPSQTATPTASPSQVRNGGKKGVRGDLQSGCRVGECRERCLSLCLRVCLSAWRCAGACGVCFVLFSPSMGAMDPVTHTPATRCRFPAHPRPATAVCHPCAGVAPRSTAPRSTAPVRRHAVAVSPVSLPQCV